MASNELVLRSNISKNGNERGFAIMSVFPLVVFSKNPTTHRICNNKAKLKCFRALVWLRTARACKFQNCARKIKSSK